MEFTIGRTNDEFSKLQLKVFADSKPRLDQTLSSLMMLGCYPVDEADCLLVAADMDGAHRRPLLQHQPSGLSSDKIRIGFPVENQRMDAVICVSMGKLHASNCET
jgi:hypothetical protein